MNQRTGLVRAAQLCAIALVLVGVGWGVASRARRNSPSIDAGPTLKELVDQLDPATQEGRTQGPGWVAWRSRSGKWSEVTASARSADSKTAALVLAKRDGKPVMALLAAQDQPRFGLVREAVPDMPGCTVVAWATKTDGVIDRVMLTTGVGQTDFISDLSGHGRPEVFATRIENERWVILVSGDLDEAFESLFLYEAARKEIVAAANYATDDDHMTDIYSRTQDGGWIEVARRDSGTRATVTAFLDSRRKNLEAALVDLDGDHLPELAITGKDGSRIRELRIPHDKSRLRMEDLADVKTHLIAACATARKRWSVVWPVIHSTKAIGLTLPKVYALP